MNLSSCSRAAEDTLSPDSTVPRAGGDFALPLACGRPGPRSQSSWVPLLNCSGLDCLVDWRLALGDQFWSLLCWFPALKPWGGLPEEPQFPHRGVGSIGRGAGPSLYLCGLFESTPNKHSIFSLSTPLVGLWQGRNVGSLDRPSPSSWLFLWLQLWACVSVS